MKQDKSHIYNWLKKGLWLYIILLIFEGALRKWLLPFLATPLLIVRDPVALWLIYYSWKHGILPSNGYMLSMTFTGFFGICTALFFGHGNLMVAIFGARILLLHFPVIFIMGAVFNREDVSKVGKVLLYLAIPMVTLIGLQFYSPQSAWVNRGIGGDMEGVGFGGVMGYFRPSGTFSFTSGNVMFFSLVTCFVLYFWVSQEKINKWILYAATMAVLASISLSISRTLFFSMGLTIIFTVLAASRKPQYLPKILGALAVGVILIAGLSQTEFFKTGIEVFTNRIEDASAIEGGVSTSLIDRVFGGMFGALSNGQDLPFFGYGLGMGTNVGSKLLTGGAGFLISEQEWGRLLGEMGFLLGMVVIIIRMSFCASITLKSYALLKQGYFLPWILLSVSLLFIAQGQWAVPTNLGFGILCGGLILASLKKDAVSFP